MKARAVMAAPVTLVKVMRKMVAVLAATVSCFTPGAAPNVLPTCGLAICSVAAAAAVLAPPLVVSAPTGIVLP